MTLTTVSQADLTEKTQEILDRVTSGEAIVVQVGQTQMVLLNFLDFRLLEALAQCAITASKHGGGLENPDSKVLGAYLAAAISLEKTAELLGLERVELQECLRRLRVPIRLSVST